MTEYKNACDRLVYKGFEITFFDNLESVGILIDEVFIPVMFKEKRGDWYASPLNETHEELCKLGLEFTDKKAKELNIEL